MSEAEEQWKSIPGYEMYDVSDRGRIRSWHNGKYGRRKEGPRVLRLWLDGSGYPQVRLSKNGQGECFLVHVLVLLAFVGPCPDSRQCCHGDGDRTNNHLDNLRWDTCLANWQDALAHGTVRLGEAHGGAKLTEANVIEIRRLYAAGGVSHAGLAAQFGVHHGTIGKITRRQGWTHVLVGDAA